MSKLFTQTVEYALRTSVNIRRADSTPQAATGLDKRHLGNMSS